MLTIIDFTKTILYFLIQIITGLNKLGLNIPLGDLEEAYSQVAGVNLKDDIADAVGGLTGNE